MFKRRTPLSPLQQLSELFWPSMGWFRTLKYMRLRIIRLSDTSHKIAAGLALGASISFTPIVGTHFIQAGALAYFFRVNMLASLIGTFVGNPWTFPFMWWAAIEFGSFLFGLFGLPASTSLPDEMSFQIFWDLIWSEPARIFLPWLMGGYLIALLSWPIFYYTFFNTVKGAKAARKRARMRKLHRVAVAMTGQKK